MTKKGTFSFEGLVDPSSTPDAPAGVEQRGAEPAKRGRPAKARTANEARPSFGLDPETHRLFKIWLLQNGVSMQDYLEAHIKSLVGNSTR